MIDIREILSILPHRYPFLLVDRILELEIGKRVVGFKNVTFNEEYFQGHFPEEPVMPGVLIIEAMAQVGGILAFKSSEEIKRKVVYFAGIDKAKFRKPVVPGDQLRMELDVLHVRQPFWKMKGTSYVEKSLVCEAELTAMISERKN
ncbi:MAG TPA: 3-hydroxyacyl-ACP dehydratase FabZ [Nitrospiria bacterium]|jgi:beta-hydroxyacyl-ACP dehydratase FabZ